MSKIQTLITEYYATKEKVKEYEDECNRKKDELMHLFQKLNTDVIKVDGYVAERKTMVSERLSKRDCPSDVWDDYATRYESDYVTVKMTDSGEKKQKRYSKERRSRKSPVRSR